MSVRPEIDISGLIESVPFWFGALAAAITEGDEAKQIKVQEALHGLGWIVLSPDQVASLQDDHDDNPTESP